MYAGKLEQKKRITDLLEALGMLREENYAVHLLVAGDGELMQQARHKAQESGLPVTFCGFLNQTEISKAYVAADCLVLPSDFDETWGLVVNEAMACGVPAIVSDRVGCGPDLVIDGDTGYRFQFGNTKELALAMRKFERLSTDERSEFGRTAKELVHKEYSISAAVEGLQNSIRFAL